MPIDLYPSVAKVKRNGVYQNLPGFVQQSGNADIEAMIANKETNTTAQYPHAKNSFFILNDILYQADENISVNGTIAVGTNCHVSILGDEILELINETTSQSEKIDELKSSVDKVYDTFSALALDVANLEDGYNVKTNGYYTLNDGGGCVYKISDTADRGGSIAVGGLYAVPVGDGLNTRQLGLKSGDNGQAIINDYIADTSYSALYIVDDIHLKKTATGQALDTIELVQIRRDDFALVFRPGGKFTLETLNEDYYRMIALREVENVTIVDPTLVGDADTIGITTGEFGHGLYIDSCENITVYNGNIGKCFGDAVCVAAGSANITFIGTLYCYSCGRQGMSVTGCDGLYVDTIVGKDILRTSPKGVIDFEPNNTTSLIRAYVKNIQGINCGRGLLVAGGSAKAITVENLYTKHSSYNYYNDFQVNGTSGTDTDSKLEIIVNNIVVENSFGIVAQFGYMNNSAMVKCKNILVNGMAKASSNSSNEATVRFDSGAKNIELNIDVINNTSPNANLGVYCSASGATFENVNIVTNDDCSQTVTDALNMANLINTTLISKPQSNSIQYINSSTQIINRDATTNYQVRAKANYVMIVNFKTDAYVLYKTNISDYTLTDTDSIITDSSSYWTIAATAKIAEFIINNTSKTITVRKIA